MFIVDIVFNQNCSLFPESAGIAVTWHVRKNSPLSRVEKICSELSWCLARAHSPGIPTATMNKLLSVVLHPLISLSIYSEEGGIDVFYLLTTFIALGIWLVVQRYQRAHNSPLPFKFKIPKVRCMSPA